MLDRAALIARLPDRPEATIEYFVPAVIESVPSKIGFFHSFRKNDLVSTFVHAAIKLLCDGTEECR